MDFRQLEYILEIAKENNITRAAKNLFISQSALNQQLLKLEQELGVQLFYRSRTNWHPTAAGEVYLDGARKAMHIRHDTYQHIQDITKSEKSQLRLGLTPDRGIAMFTKIYADLHHNYRKLMILPLEMPVRHQFRALYNGDIDIGFITIHESQLGNDEYIHICPEEIVIILPKSHPLAKKAAPPSEPLACLDLRLLSDEPFTLMYKSSTNRAICDDIFAANGITPNIVMETSTTDSIVSMVETIHCCGLLPRYYMEGAKDRVASFVMPEHPTWDLYIMYRKNSYLSLANKEYIRLVKEFWNETLPPVQTN